MVTIGIAVSVGTAVGGAVVGDGVVAGLGVCWSGSEVRQVGGGHSGGAAVIVLGAIVTLARVGVTTPADGWEASPEQPRAAPKTARNDANNWTTSRFLIISLPGGRQTSGSPLPAKAIDGPTRKSIADRLGTDTERKAHSARSKNPDTRQPETAVIIEHLARECQ